MLNDFRKFVMRGNVLDLAVAVVVGAAFNAVVQSFVDNLLNPFVAAIFGKPDFSQVATLTVRESASGDSVLRFGAWATDIVNFVIIAFSVFLVIRTFEALQARRGEDGAGDETGPSEVDLLTEIRDALRTR